MFASPAEVLHGLRPEEARRPRPHPGAAADREEGHQRGPRRQGQDQASRRCRASPTAWCRPPSAGCCSTTSCTPKMAFYDLALSSKHLSRIIADCYQLLGRRETIDLLDRMKETRLPRIDALGPELRHRRPATPAQQGRRCCKETEKEVEQLPQAVRRAATSPRASATTRSSTCGRTPATRSPSR